MQRSSGKNTVLSGKLTKIIATICVIIIVFFAYMMRVVDRALYVPCHPKAKTYLNLPEHAVEFEKKTTPRLPIESKWITSPYTHHRIQSSDTIELDTWWIPAVKKTKRTIILVHGYRSSKHSPRLLYLAGMYHYAGYNVAMFDYRNHGYSSCPTHMHTGGQRESDDLLAVKKWLETKQGIPSASIGVHGVSLGGLTAMIALDKDPKLAAVIAETPPYHMQTVAASELKRQGVPTIIQPIIIGLEEGLVRYRLGIDLDEVTAKMGIDNLNNRPLMVIFAKQDRRVPYYGHFKRIISDAMCAQQPLDLVVLDGADHDSYMEKILPWYEARTTGFFNKYLSHDKTSIKVKKSVITIEAHKVPAS